MSYCKVHGRYEGSGCSDCRDAEEQSALDREEIIRELARSREESKENLAAAVSHIANSKNNPGDYICPACRYTTLKYLASRCPICHINIDGEYWIPITAAIERAKKEAEKRAKEAAIQRAKQEAERKVREAADREAEAAGRKIEIFFKIVGALLMVFAEYSCITDLNRNKTVTTSQAPNLSFERDAVEARRPSTLR